MTIRILHGDCRNVLATLPAESVHCVVTSPPYWGLRDYGVAGQLGLRDLFIKHVRKGIVSTRILQARANRFNNIAVSVEDWGK
jgi:DNA modification methylase